MAEKGWNIEVHALGFVHYHMQCFKHNILKCHLNNQEDELKN